ncbi:MAG: di-heme oxidoredictase family protein [Candidatus Thiodiazotropha sp.]
MKGAWIIRTGIILAGLCLPVRANSGMDDTGYAEQLYSRPLPGMSAEQRFQFHIGKSLFERIWVSAPASTRAADGLGPLYNARSCVACHPKHGRGRPPADPAEPPLSLVLKLDVPVPQAEPPDITQNNRPEPVYGLQIQNAAVAGHPGEAKISVRYRDIPFTLPEAETVQLRQPVYEILETRYGELHPDTRRSPRLAPQLVGLGLLDTIPQEMLVTRSDAEDRDGDGISGQVNWVWSREAQKLLPGRFGHKAGLVNLDEMTQSAFFTDIGLSTPLYPEAYGDCTEQQSACRTARHGTSSMQTEPEAPQFVVAAVRDYLSQLAPPPRPAQTPDILEGQRLFESIGCDSCHVSRYEVMHNGQRQAIHPYTDLLLHDLGDGLSDRRPEGLASGREWRTAPLWGVGRAIQANGHGYYLHDGRARTLLEAILWHAGEAEPHRDAVVALSTQQRSQLLRFIESL